MSQPKEIFVIQDRCMGCHSCEVACAVAHAAAPSLYAALGARPTPKNRVYVEWVAPDGKMPIVCRHCEDAPCLNACISGAITRNGNNAVLTNEEKCIGCWTCVMMCPFGVIGRHLETRKAYRCDRCEGQPEPACVRACPTKALQYATVEALNNDTRRKNAHKMMAESTGHSE